DAHRSPPDLYLMIVAGAALPPEERPRDGGQAAGLLAPSIGAIACRRATPVSGVNEMWITRGAAAAASRAESTSVDAAWYLRRKSLEQRHLRVWESTPDRLGAREIAFCSCRRQ